MCASERYGSLHLNEGGFLIESTGFILSVGKYICGFVGKTLNYRKSNCTRSPTSLSFYYRNNNNNIEDSIYYDAGVPKIYGMLYSIKRVSAICASQESEPAVLYCMNLNIENSSILYQKITIYSNILADRDKNVKNCRISALIYRGYNETGTLVNETTAEDFEYPKLSSMCILDTNKYETLTDNFTDRITGVISYNLEIKDSVFYACSCNFFGGAILLDVEYLTLNIYSTTFYKCSSRKGGAIYAKIDNFGDMNNICSYYCAAVEESFMYLSTKSLFNGYNNISLISIIDSRKKNNIHSSVMTGKFNAISYLNITCSAVFKNLCVDMVASKMNNLAISGCESDDALLRVDACTFNKAVFINNTINERSALSFIECTSSNAKFVESNFFKNLGLLGFCNCAHYTNCSCDVVPEYERKESFTIINETPKIANINIICPYYYSPEEQKSSNTKKIIIIATSSVIGILIIGVIIFAVVIRKIMIKEKAKSELSQNIISDFG